MSKINLCAYLHFNGNARDVLEFYKSVFGGELNISTYGDFPSPELDEKVKDQVMHGDLESEKIRIMVSDSGPMGPGIIGTNMSLSLSGEKDDEALLSEWYKKLREGGKIAVPLDKSPWGDTFAMFSDKFGISWMVNIGH